MKSGRIPDDRVPEMTELVLLLVLSTEALATSAFVLREPPLCDLSVDRLAELADQVWGSALFRGLEQGGDGRGLRVDRLRTGSARTS